MAGFSLVELMLSLSLGVVLSGAMLQGLLADGHNSGRLFRLMRERAAQRRTLALIGSDLQQSTGVGFSPEPHEAACNLAGRQPLFHLYSTAGRITYSAGPPPSDIWRGHVLMRCGPAYRLDGSLSSQATPQNRVVLDGLARREAGVEVHLDSAALLLQLRLLQLLPGGRELRIQTEKSFALAAHKLD